MADVWLELAPGTKHPVEKGWQRFDYKGIMHDLDVPEWVGLRLDDWIVVDCDDDDARDRWLAHVDGGLHHTWVRKTPHGWHFMYRRNYSNLTVTAKVPWRVMGEKIDLKVGIGHQVVLIAPGYSDWTGSSEVDAVPFDMAWLPPESASTTWAGDEWDEMPDGMGDNSMTAFAGTFRRWGMDEKTMARCLAAINDITMTEKPMPLRSIKRIAHSVAKHNPEDAKTVICPGCEAEVEIR